MDRSEVEPGLTGLGEPLEIFGEAAPAIEPGERALDDPPPRQHDEAVRFGRVPNDLQCEVGALPNGGFEFAPVGFIGPDPAQARVAVGRLGKDQFGAVRSWSRAVWTAATRPSGWASAIFWTNASIRLRTISP